MCVSVCVILKNLLVGVSSQTQTICGPHIFSLMKQGHALFWQCEKWILVRSLAAWEFGRLWHLKEEGERETRLQLAPSNFCATENTDVCVLIIVKTCLKVKRWTLRGERKGNMSPKGHLPKWQGLAEGHGGKCSGCVLQRATSPVVVYAAGS